MDISNINSSTVSTLRNSDIAASRIEREGRKDQEAQVRVPENKAGQLLKALEKTLDQSGLAPAASSRPPVATETQANDAESASSKTAQNAGQALPEFMNALFQALNATGNGAQRTESSSEASEDGNTVSASRRTDAYSDLAGRLQNLAQSLGTPTDSGTSTTGSSKTSDLETSFQNLALALQGKTSPETTAQSAPDLQSFLKTLAHNLKSAGSRLDSAGNLVNTQA